MGQFKQYVESLLTCGGFALLATFLSRRASLPVAVGLGLLVVVAAQFGRRRRAASSPRPGGRGELG
ncbi:hypothetical protein [Kribbella sp. C-35]|uniref:hypothetical protein n=1 Tax=Kribbella sp. C-35 TaxID=2789276 RepID=UPI003978ADF5